MKQTLISTTIVFFFLLLMVSIGNINCSDQDNAPSSTILEKDNLPNRKPTLYKSPDANTPINVFIPNPNYVYRGEDEPCKMQLCFCCTDEGRYYEMYDVGGGPAVGSWYTDGSGCLDALANTIKGHSYIVYEFNVNCAEEDNPPTYFTACTCNTDIDIDTIRCCPESVKIKQ